ncbi:MAG TPA: extracellular solute-binding protein [Acidimicrobiales bacterium]|nr:extracellular solute-binding protein [Acidimicrobiales bacterium]
MAARRFVVSLACIGLVAAGCSSTSSTRAGSAPATTAPVPPISTTVRGPVQVLYAGSLVTLMDHHVGPAFQAATGLTLSGVSGDSGSLAGEIKGGTQQGDVFISASPSKDQILEGPANGDWVGWYANFATSDLVLGYNPHSRFASQLRSSPWYDVVTRPGFLLGRTDPSTDPKGKLTVTALADAAAQGAPTGPLSKSTSNVFPESTLVGRLQSGQLDAGFFYAVEAASAGIPTVPLTGIASLQAHYTVTVLNRAPHPAAAAEFVRYLLGPQGAAELAREGLTVARPIDVSGTPPADLQAVLSGR